MTLSLANDLPRFGVKGRAAADWLKLQGIVLPPQPNAWLAQDDQSRILRLGRSEFMIEGPAAEKLQSTWLGDQPDLFRVPRYDAAFVLSGQETRSLLQEICALDTRPTIMKNQVLMTLAAGISVTLICEANAIAPVYRLWCDATYGEYMHHILQEILTQPV